ncbi:lytic transglycosylase domain-containing protein [Tenacibaculum jejuense]|uniref:Membrane-bound lytic murein transglycosylase D n=1 Tax=Tenacibaculum jejuense TaxID=584609 RepID=A0A238U6G6_9FLAO|nr:lytic transglycosylase domain-containing protein [Tenacibaculum jejuense]SNR13980.1 Membrane-bound lytic murein transglycosylase D [Tenacibaculum jejuense]
MKKFFVLSLFSIANLFAQNQPVDSIKEIDLITKTIIRKDSIPNSASDSIPQKKLIVKERYTNDDLKRIDSLLVEAKLYSPLFDSVPYIINDKDLVTNVTPVVTPELLKERLALINQETPFNLAFNPALERVINNYLKYRKKYYPALMSRAKYFFPMFERYLDQYDIPLEMKYLAIVESSLRPQIKSRVGATGLWQFMYGTGKQYKLAVNSYVDERQDPVKSTIAACKYLTFLHGLFNDWDLALAAYNSGPGNVLKAIKRSGGYRNYWNIRPFLPRETAGYVPAFYATMYIFKYADELGLYPESPKIFNFQTDTIQVKRTVSFDQIAEKIDINTEMLSFLNPQYKIDIIPFVKKKKFSIRLPRNKTIDFLEKEKEIYALAAAEDSLREKPLPKYFEMDKRIRYKVRSGDYLGKIAIKFGVRVKDIKRWNNMRNSNLRAGQRLYIYPRRM